MSRERLEELNKAIAKETIKYGQIQTFFKDTTLRYRLRNKEEIEEVVAQLQASAECLARFRIEYSNLIAEIALEMPL